MLVQGSPNKKDPGEVYDVLLSLHLYFSFSFILLYYSIDVGIKENMLLIN